MGKVGRVGKKGASRAAKAAATSAEQEVKQDAKEQIKAFWNSEGAQNVRKGFSEFMGNENVGRVAANSAFMGSVGAVGNTVYQAGMNGDYDVLGNSMKGFMGGALMGGLVAGAGVARKGMLANKGGGAARAAEGAATKEFAKPMGVRGAPGTITDEQYLAMLKDMEAMGASKRAKAAAAAAAAAKVPKASVLPKGAASNAPISSTSILDAGTGPVVTSNSPAARFMDISAPAGAPSLISSSRSVNRGNPLLTSVLKVTKTRSEIVANQRGAVIPAMPKSGHNRSFIPDAGASDARFLGEMIDNEINASRVLAKNTQFAGRKITPAAGMFPKIERQVPKPNFYVGENGVGTSIAQVRHDAAASRRAIDPTSGPTILATSDGVARPQTSTGQAWNSLNNRKKGR